MKLFAIVHVDQALITGLVDPVFDRREGSRRRQLLVPRVF